GLAPGPPGRRRRPRRAAGPPALRPARARPRRAGREGASLNCRGVTVTGDIRLTELVSCGGCAAKYSAALLDQLVATLPVDADPNPLVGLAPADDAAG